MTWPWLWDWRPMFPPDELETIALDVVPVWELETGPGVSLNRRRRTASFLVGAGVLKNAPGTCRIGVAVGWKVAMLSQSRTLRFLLQLSTDASQASMAGLEALGSFS